MSDTDIETTIRKYLLFKRKPHSEENDKDILYNKNLLINYSKKFYYFSSLLFAAKNCNIENIISKTIDQMEFIFCRKDTKIWNIGDIADDIFLIFIGEVNIYKTPEKKDKNLIMQLDSILGKGHLIGSDCLKYYGDERRTYLAKAKCKCILGKINVKEYIKIYKPIISEENIVVANFLRDINIFSSEFNVKFQKVLTLKYYKKDDYIFKQDELYDSFYLIFKGSIRLFVNMKKTVKSKFGYDLLKGNNKNKRFTTSRQFELKGSYDELIKYNLIDAGRGDFIGGIEYLDNISTYKCSAKCLKDVAILKIDLGLFNAILINKERKNFKDKIDKQKEFISKRMIDIKLGKELTKLNDYLLSKNKYVKAFLDSNPLNKNTEEKLDKYINCNVSPIKIKYKNNNIKILNTTKNLISKYIEDYKSTKKRKIFWRKPSLKIKDFVTNIDYKRKVYVENIFPIIFSDANIKTCHKKIYKIKSENSKVDKKVNTEPILFENENLKKIRSFSNTNIRKSLPLRKRKEIFFNNENFNNHLLLDLRRKFDKKQLENKRKVNRYNTFKK